MKQGILTGFNLENPNILTSFEDLKRIKGFGLEKLISRLNQRNIDEETLINLQFPLKTNEKGFSPTIFIERPEYFALKPQNERIEPFLKEELKFLIENCPFDEKSGFLLKETEFPLPSSHFLHKKAYEPAEKPSDFSLIIDFFCNFLQYEPESLLSLYKRLEKRLLPLNKDLKKETFKKDFFI